MKILCVSSMYSCYELVECLACSVFPSPLTFLHKYMFEVVDGA